MENNFNAPQIPVPNATVVLVLGIISIPTCCVFYGIVGIACAIVALVLAYTGSKQYNVAPENYTESSYKNLNAGKICAIIGLIFSILAIISVIWLISVIGIENLNNPEVIQERVQELLNR
jgi:hypothetical protein